MAHDRDVAGIRCTEVLELLPDFVEDTLEPEVEERVEAHLRGCDWCERFGGAYGRAVGVLRESLGEPVRVSDAVRARIRAGLNGG